VISAIGGDGNSKRPKKIGPSKREISVPGSEFRPGEGGSKLPRTRIYLKRKKCEFNGSSTRGIPMIQISSPEIREKTGRMDLEYKSQVDDYGHSIPSIQPEISGGGKRIW